MITQKHQDLLIAQLERMTELELAPICKALREHCDKNKMDHLLADDLSDLVEQLQDELSESNKSLEEITVEKDRLVDLVDVTKTALEDVIQEEAAFDWMQDKIQDIIDTL